MKKRIINLAIGLTGLIVSFLPQKAEAIWCEANCEKDSCSVFGWVVECYCDSNGNSHCNA
ncbi:MAG: hypothetical protein F4X75_09275 [Gemmatimonadetes bacterium]|nr:hypothetical protein [Gemmatimonadota bacterium]